MATGIVFIVEEEPAGGFIARALGHAIFTQADDMHRLREAIRDAVECHFPDATRRPRGISLRARTPEGRA